MKIVYLSTSGTLGGAELDLLDIVSALRTGRPDWRLSVVLGADGPFRQELERLGIACTLLPLPASVSRLGDAGLRTFGSAARLAARAPWAVLGVVGYLNQLRRVFQAERPDWIQTNDMKGHVLGAWAAPSGVPLAWYLQDFLATRPVMSKLLRRSVSARVRPVGISQAVASDAAEVLGRPIATIPFVYPGIDLERFAPGPGVGSKLDEAAGWPIAEPGTVRVGLVATFARWKGHEVFLDAVRRLKNESEALGRCRFYVIGGPIYRSLGSQYSLEELQQVAERLGLKGQVGFTGHQSDPASAIRGLDVVVHASTSPEPFGRVIVEGMACERAVVAVRAGGAAELFEDQVEAIGCPPSDPSALALALQRVIADPELRQRLGVSGRQAVVLRFGRPRLAGDWSRVLGASEPRLRQHQTTQQVSQPQP